jgi:predicted nucleic acid-binding protein
VPETLWDTSAIIDPLDRPDDSIAISIVTVLELAAGVNAAPNAAERTARLGLLTGVLQSFDALPVDDPVARAYVLVDAAVRAAGRQPRRRFADLQIAATAIAHGLPLVTRNPRDFEGLDDLLDVVTA